MLPKVADYIQYLSDTDAVIFLLHGVINKNATFIRNYTNKHVERERFISLISTLALSGYPISLDEIVYHVTNRIPFPKNSFAISFDDGFENNYSIAAPILSDHKVPTIFYVTTNFIDTNSMSWIDQIEYCVENTKKSTIRFSMFDNPIQLASKEEKWDFLNKIRMRVKNSPEDYANIHFIIKELFSVCQVEYTTFSDHPLDKKMSWLQIAALSSDPLFTIGGHTHTHPIMSFLSPERLDREIDISLERISSHLKIKPIHYSYPEGLEHCYNDFVISALKKRDIVCCPSAIHGINPLNSCLFNLKRVNFF